MASTKKIFLNIASDFLRYINATLLGNQIKQQDSDLLVPNIVTRAKNITQKKDIMVVTLDDGNTNG